MKKAISVQKVSVKKEHQKGALKSGSAKVSHKADKSRSVAEVAQKEEGKQISERAKKSEIVHLGKASTPAQQEEKPRVRIRLKAFDHKIIDESARIIIEMVQRTGAEIRGPIPLPTEIKKYTVNRSTFVHKDSREQFEMRVHKRLIDILAPTSKTIDGLTGLNLPSGVDVEIKM